MTTMIQPKEIITLVETVINEIQITGKNKRKIINILNQSLSVSDPEDLMDLRSFIELYAQAITHSLEDYEEITKEDFAELYDISTGVMQHCYGELKGTELYKAVEDNQGYGLEMFFESKLFSHESAVEFTTNYLDKLNYI